MTQAPRMHINIKIVLSIFLFALFIGLFTYRLGCNPAVLDKCSSYNLVSGHVFAYSNSKKDCRKVENMKRCDQPYVMAHYGSHNATCKFVSGEIMNTAGDAATNSNLYHIGETYNLLQSKDDPKHCYTFRSVTTSWYTSIVCLWVAGLCLVLVIKSLLTDLIQRNRSPGERGEYVNIDDLPQSHDERDKSHIYGDIAMVRVQQEGALV
jgi:hypothetical protein